MNVRKDGGDIMTRTDIITEQGNCIKQTLGHIIRQSLQDLNTLDKLVRNDAKDFIFTDRLDRFIDTWDLDLSPGWVRRIARDRIREERQGLDILNRQEREVMLPGRKNFK